jgi:hypothetical protein
VRREPSNCNMWPEPPSEAALARCLRGIILLLLVIILLTPSEEEEFRELLKHHTPFERSSHPAIRYSKMSKQSTINDNREAPVYERSKQSRDPHFWSLFHSDLYWSIYLHKKKPVVETQWINWDWMASRRHTIFNQIKATCDELELTKIMSFKYDCQFYSSFYFDTDAQKLMWMTDGQRYEITV